MSMIKAVVRPVCPAPSNGDESHKRKKKVGKICDSDFEHLHESSNFWQTFHFDGISGCSPNLIGTIEKSRLWFGRFIHLPRLLFGIGVPPEGVSIRPLVVNGQQQQERPDCFYSECKGAASENAAHAPTSTSFPPCEQALGKYFKSCLYRFFHNMGRVSPSLTHPRLKIECAK
jgi:hypothetical protein